MNKSLKLKLIVVLLIIAVLPMGIASYLSLQATKDVVVKSYEESNLEVVKEIEYAIENYVHAYKMAIDIYSVNELIRNVSVDPGAGLWIKKEFNEFVDKYPEVHSIHIGTEKGKIINSNNSRLKDDIDPRNLNWYLTAKDSQELSWTPITYHEDGTVEFAVAKPIFDLGNKFIGVIAIELDMNVLEERMNKISIGNEGYPVLVDDSNTIITHKDHAQVGKILPVEAIVEALSKEDEGIVEYTWKAEKKFASFKKFDELGWSVLVTMTEDEINSVINPIKWTSIIITFIVAVLSIFIAMVLAKRLVRPIVSLEETMNQVQAGDLTVRAEQMTHDEIGKIAHSFNIMLDHFSDMLSKSKNVAVKVSSSAQDLASGSEEVSASSSDIARTVDEIATGASEQANEAEHSSQLMYSLAEKLRVLNKDSEMMAQAAREVHNANQNGSQVMVNLEEQTSITTTSTRGIEAAVKRLEDRTREIGVILETITSIADQTNLLALNASIEAARAGEHGRGFAVVADEIRKLAEGSSQASDNIRQIIISIQDESEKTVKAVSEVVQVSHDQGLAVSSAQGVFTDIQAATEKIAGIIDEVVNFIEGVNHDKEEMVLAIEKISAVSEEAAASSEEVTASVEQQASAMDEVARSAEILNDMADELQNEINKFKL